MAISPFSAWLLRERMTGRQLFHILKYRLALKKCICLRILCQYAISRNIHSQPRIATSCLERLYAQHFFFSIKIGFLFRQKIAHSLMATRIMVATIGVRGHRKQQ